jgi:hypothetical protein
MVATGDPASDQRPQQAAAGSKQHDVAEKRPPGLPIVAVPSTRGAQMCEALLRAWPGAGAAVHATAPVAHRRVAARTAGAGESPTARGKAQPRGLPLRSGPVRNVNGMAGGQVRRARFSFMICSYQPRTPTPSLDFGLPPLIDDGWRAVMDRLGSSWCIRGCNTHRRRGRTGGRSCAPSVPWYRKTRGWRAYAACGLESITPTDWPGISENPLSRLHRILPMGPRGPGKEPSSLDSSSLGFGVGERRIGPGRRPARTTTYNQLFL